MPSRARVNTPVSQKELERRWTAVRAAMKDAGVDVLLTQANTASGGGYLRYLTDIIGGGNPTSVIFPAEGTMTVVRHGGMGGDRDLSKNPDEMLPGVGRVLTTAHFASAHFAKEYDGLLAAKALAPYANKTIGLCGTSQMMYAFVDTVKRELPKANFVETSDLMDRIIVIKSEEEKEIIRKTALLQDATMEKVFELIEPGKCERDVIAEAVAWATGQGSDYGSYSMGSEQPGTAAHFSGAHMQNKIIEKGDISSILVENSGAGGYYCELGRTYVLGKAPAALKEEHEFTLSAQRLCLDMLKPGTKCADIWEKYNAFMRENGRPEEARIHCHGQGYYLVERPLVRYDEDMSIEKDMNMTCHPSYDWNNMWSWICDNYLISDDGAGESIHKLPQHIFEL